MRLRQVPTTVAERRAGACHRWEPGGPSVGNVGWRVEGVLGNRIGVLFGGGWWEDACTGLNRVEQGQALRERDLGISHRMSEQLILGNAECTGRRLRSQDRRDHNTEFRPETLELFSALFSK